MIGELGRRSSLALLIHSALIQAVTFLEHFIGWEDPAALLQNGLALALVSISLVAFQFITHYTKETARKSQYRVQDSAQHELFDENRDRRAPSRQGNETQEA